MASKRIEGSGIDLDSVVPQYLSISCCFNVKWQAGAIVIAGLISPYAADRDYAREAVSAFFESIRQEKETSSKELSSCGNELELHRNYGSL